MGRNPYHSPLQLLMYLIRSRLVIENFEFLNKDRPRPANNVFIPFLRRLTCLLFIFLFYFSMATFELKFN